MYNTFISYLIIINLVGFLIMFIDKRRAIKNQWRVSEKALISISVIGGSLGMLLGMNIFHHKTKHMKFTLGVPTIIIVQVIILYMFLN